MVQSGLGIHGLMFWDRLGPRGFKFVAGGGGGWGLRAWGLGLVTQEFGS